MLNYVHAFITTAAGAASKFLLIYKVLHAAQLCSYIHNGDVACIFEVAPRAWQVVIDVGTLPSLWRSLAYASTTMIVSIAAMICIVLHVEWRSCKTRYSNSPLVGLGVNWQHSFALRVAFMPLASENQLSCSRTAVQSLRGRMVTRSSVLCQCQDPSLRTGATHYYVSEFFLAETGLQFVSKTTGSHWLTT